MSSSQFAYTEEADFLAKVDSVLLDANVQVGNEQSVIGCADRKKKIIRLNFELLKDSANEDYDEFLRLVKGINYHELAHLFYSKNTRKLIYDNNLGWTKSRQVEEIYSIVEDGRIETLFSRRFRKVEDYFKRTALKFCFDKKLQGFNINLFMLMYCRKSFIPKEILDKLEIISKDAMQPEQFTLLKKLIDEYIATPGAEGQFEILKKLRDIVYPENSQDRGHTDNPLKTEEHITQQRNPSQEEKELSDDLAKENNKDKVTQQEIDNTDKKIDRDADTKDSDKKEELQEEIKELIKDLVDKVTDKIQEQIEQQKDAMQKYDFGDGASLNDEIENSFTGSFVTEFHPTRDHADQTKRLINQMRVLKCGLQSSTQFFQKRGKLDVKSIMRNEPTGKFGDFKQQKNTRLTKSKIGAVIFIDASGSMCNTEYNTAVSSAWSISSALEALGGSVKVVEFSDKPRTIKTIDQRTSSVKWDRKQCGSTAIVPGLKQCFRDQRKFKQLNISNHVAIIVTDGDFGDYPVEIVRELREQKMKVIVLKVKSSRNGQLRDSDYSKVVYLPNFEGLNTAMQTVITDLQRDIVREIEG